MPAADSFAPCRFHEYKGSFSVTFTEIEPFIGLLERHGGQGGGYSWESIVKAVLEMRSLTLPDVTFDPEGDMFAAASANKESLQAVASLVRELASDRALMERAIGLAKEKGYFE